MQSNKNTLGLGGDGDDLELIELLEQAFDVKFGDEDLKSIENVGGFYDAIVNQLPPLKPRADRCLTAATYYKLKRAILSRRPDLTVKPSTPLSVFVNTGECGSWWQYLSAESKLVLPQPTIGAFAAIVGITLFFAALFLFPILGIIFGDWTYGLYAILSMTGCVLIFRFSTPHVPSDTWTAGDLAKATLPLNFATISKECETARPQDVWDAMVWIMREPTGYPGPIDRTTRLFA